MRGVITDREVLANARLIWSEFGTRCLFRCLSAMLRGERTTFLDLALKSEMKRRRRTTSTQVVVSLTEVRTPPQQRAAPRARRLA